jgi:hypothetical protein
MGEAGLLTVMSAVVRLVDSSPSTRRESRGIEQVDGRGCGCRVSSKSIVRACGSGFGVSAVVLATRASDYLQTRTRGLCSASEGRRVV